MCGDKEKIDELVDMLDELVKSGTGHINVTSGDGAISVSTGKSTDCGNTQSPCMIPTLHKGIDE